ncbi:MAG: amidohydrolase [Opitutaceae bacterium]|nr:amidohydrolase [Opitutaceae bacterium]
MRARLALLSLALGLSVSAGAANPEARPEALRALVQARVAAEYPSLEAIYRDLHAHPELSFLEVRTAGIVANELRALGITVTEHVGNTGVVGVLRNGQGPTVMVRADMDALPIREETGLPYASKVEMDDLAGRRQPVMHACAHDAHIAGFIGTARTLVGLQAHWSGTVLFVAQPAEEIGGGALAMLNDGLFERFPAPDYALALHVWGSLPAGVIGFAEGPTYANVDSVDILVRGYGGHGSRPHLTKDPIVLAAEIVTALQTIVSRELEPGTPAVVTVGSIHGGTKHNIIPDDVKLQLTLRSYSDPVADHLIGSIRRICENLARAAGVSEDRLPVVTMAEQRTPSVYNDPTLTRRLTGSFRQWFGENRVVPEKPTTGGEDFARYGRTNRRIPLSIWWVGGQDPAKIEANLRTGAPLPWNHSAQFAPVPEPTLKAAVTSMTAAVLDLLGKPAAQERGADARGRPAGY